MSRESCRATGSELGGRQTSWGRGSGQSLLRQNLRIMSPKSCSNSARARRLTFKARCVCVCTCRGGKRCPCQMNCLENVSFLVQQTRIARPQHATCCCKRWRRIGEPDLSAPGLHVCKPGDSARSPPPCRALSTWEVPGPERGEVMPGGLDSCDPGRSPPPPPPPRWL